MTELKKVGKEMARAALEVDISLGNEGDDQNQKDHSNYNEERDHVEQD